MSRKTNNHMTAGIGGKTKQHGYENSQTTNSTDNAPSYGAGTQERIPVKPRSESSSRRKETKMTINNENMTAAKYTPLSILSPESWDKVDTHISKAQRTLLKTQGCTDVRCASKEELRLILSGIYHHRDTTSRWSEIPDKYGDYTTIYRHFRHWHKVGLIGKVDRLLRKEQKKIDDEKMKATRELIESMRIPKRVPTDFDKASESVKCLVYYFGQYIEKLPKHFDYLADADQSSLIAYLESEIDSLAVLFKHMKNGSLELAAQVLDARQNNKQCWSESSKNHFGFTEAEAAISNASFCISMYTEKYMKIYSNLVDDDKSMLTARLFNELERLHALLRDLKEIEQMTIQASQT
jgi:transposase